MPRRTGMEAERAATKTHESRWRYFLRNHAFREDLNTLLNTYDLIQESIRGEWEAVSKERAPKGDLETKATSPSRARRTKYFDLGPPSDAARRTSELERKARLLEEQLTGLAAAKGLWFPAWQLQNRRNL